MDVDAVTVAIFAGFDSSTDPSYHSFTHKDGIARWSSCCSLQQPTEADGRCLQRCEMHIITTVGSTFFA